MDGSLPGILICCLFRESPEQVCKTGQAGLCTTVEGQGVPVPVYAGDYVEWINTGFSGITDNFVGGGLPDASCGVIDDPEERLLVAFVH